MARGTGVHIDGLRETVRSLEKMGVSVQDLKDAFTRIGTRVADKASGQVPRSSGRLASTIKPSKTKNKAVVRAGSARVPYAGVINYGWPSRGISASNFLTGPANDARADAVDQLEQELNQLINRYGLNP